MAEFVAVFEVLICPVTYVFTANSVGNLTLVASAKVVSLDLLDEFSFKAVAAAAVAALPVTVAPNVLMFDCKVVSALVLLVTSAAKFDVNVFSALVALINSESKFDVNVLSVAVALFTSAAKFAVNILSAAILAAVSAAKAFDVAVALAST